MDIDGRGTILDVTTKKPFDLIVEGLFHKRAERAGFEPAVRFPQRRISNAVLSAAQPPLLDLSVSRHYIG